MPRLLTDAPVEEIAKALAASAGDTTAAAEAVKPKRPRKKKTPPPVAEQPAATSPAPPPAPTACVECHAPLAWRDRAYVPARGGARCKRCFQRLERERVTRGVLVTPPPNGGGANRRDRRRAGVRSPRGPQGAYPLQLALVRWQRQKKGAA